MNVTCILCDMSFSPTSTQKRRLRKHPFRIILCPDCDQRIAQQTKQRLTQSAVKQETGHSLADPQKHSDLERRN